ncbi:MAG: SCO family protein [Balneola sp.]|jgi:protein SCO1/2|nr:SCO family protein [Balneola sp.]MBE79991.1 SCO family protein [Balneola sp.]|tara:strand:+ start:39 stop:614 length:576 start_codon:yes stop_codon:yes gene_type:complete
MKKLLLLALPFLVIACGNNPDVIEDMGDASFKLVDADSNSVTFPDDFEGDYVVMGFIYTNCPDICSLITQNLVKIQKDLNYPEDVQFIAATFDPNRDTPSALKKYGNAFGVDKNFTFLTGDSTEVFALMDSARVRSQISLSRETESGEKLYFINHSDKIMVLDKQARVIFEYGGSQKMIPSLVVEDLNKVR